MAKNKRISGIDIDQDLVYQQKEWRVQRIGWVIMGVIILSALLGIFGKGPLANARLGDPTGALTANYTRFERYRSPATIEVIVGPNVAKEGRIGISFNREFIDRIDIARIDPEPAAVKSDMNRIVYEFELMDGSQPAHIFIDYEHERFGTTEAHMTLTDGPEITLRQLIYP